MARIKFSIGDVENHKCEAGRSQAFIWDSAAPGLGLRATPAKGRKCYVFQSKLSGKTIRINIGSPKVWSIEAARKEARRFQTEIDLGKDPRQLLADGLAAAQDVRDARKAAIEAAEQEARSFAEAVQIKRRRDSVTLGSVWPEYMAERSPLWSAIHIASHRKIIQAGGEARSRSPKLTSPGPLAALSDVRLIDLDMGRIEAWARAEVVTRPSSARLAMRLLKACLNWCAAHPAYGQLVTLNAAKSTKARESLGKPRVKNDVLQREQLASWFESVGKIRNPVISAYLQCLLLTGARREEMACLRWADVDQRWSSIKLADKVEDFRMVPLTPYVAYLLTTLPRRNEYVFSSPTAAAGHIAEPRIAHNEAIAIAGLPHLTLHGLRRSFASLCEWTETPTGISAQIQGHAPQGVREQNYIRRPLDLLRMWHVKIEKWILEQAGIEFRAAPAGLRAIN